MFEELIQDIKTEAAGNANDIGWRFLLTSKNTLEQNNGILLVSLNPGGDREQPDHPSESCEAGSAYLAESWKSKAPGTNKLQVQIQHLFREIATRIGVDDYKAVLESSVCGHFIPFRSPSFEILKDKNRTIAFSIQLWKKLLTKKEFRLIICIDKNSYRTFSEILADNGYNKLAEQAEPIEWGKYTSLISHFKQGEKKTSLVWFPHLSKFAIFGREKSKAAITRIMDEALKYY